MSLIKVPCDLCGSIQFEPVYPGTVAVDEMDPASYFASSRIKAGYLPIVRCLACGLVMTNPRDDVDTLAKIYGNLQDCVYEMEDTQRQRTTRRYLRWVSRYRTPPGRLLDAGCATGIFLQQAQTQGWQVSGIEPSSWALERARSRCPQVLLQQASLESADFTAHSFDVVTLWDVLEHVPHPTQVLQNISAWLAPSGWLFLNLPNFSSFTAGYMGRHWVLLLREHLWYFTPKTLAQLLQQTGFEIIDVRPNWVSFSMGAVFGRLAQYLVPGSRFQRVLMHWAAHLPISISFPMGEMRVAARKG